MPSLHSYPIDLGLPDLTRLLEDLHSTCDPEFDAITEELERQFQEIRFSCGQEYHN